MLLYRLALTFAAPILAIMLTVRGIRGRERWADLMERLGLGPSARGKAPVLWVHGASNGELTSARALIEELAAGDPGRPVCVTCNTLTARAMVRAWGLARVETRLAPLDYRLCLRGFLRRQPIAGLVIIENELWPNRLAVLHGRSVPVILVAARVSERSAQRWARARALLAPLLRPVALALPQDAGTGARLTELGLRPESLGAPVDLKAAVTVPEPEDEVLAALRPAFPRADTVLAASTHGGEEGPILQAFASARVARPALRLILAPRHPVRAPEIAGLIREAGLQFATRSAGEEASPDIPVYLADTMGEMALWYTLSGTCVIGGSLVPKGGHTPYEPARFGCALIHGPDMANQRSAADRLRAAEAAVEVRDAESLAHALVRLTPERQAALGARAQAALAAPDLTGLAAQIEAKLQSPS